MDSTIVANVFLCLALIASGSAILMILKRLGQKRAFLLCAVLFGLLLLYVPFYFGGQLSVYLFGLTSSPAVAKTFAIIMGEILDAPFLFMKTVTVLSALSAVVLLAAAFVVFCDVTVLIVHLFRKFILPCFDNPCRPRSSGRVVFPFCRAGGRMLCLALCKLNN